MKKNQKYEAWNFHALKKTFLVMRIILVLSVISIIQSFALESSGQNSKISISAKEMKLEDILMQIENQTNYRFAYNKNEIDVDKTYTINITNGEIKELLSHLFLKGDVNYDIINRQIILFPSKESSAINQQQKSVSGKIADSSGSPLPGVSIVVKGTTNGAITDANGKYSLSNVPTNATLQFSFVGMKSQEIKVGTQNTINVVLIEETVGIDEVVAVGYGKQKRADVTGSVSSVKADNLTFKTTSNPLEALQGKVPGLSITNNSGRPGGEMNVNIRGFNSITASNTPLFVIDGVVGADFETINPSDIESVDVLKDASSTAIYGSRGANGVIIVTTKKAKIGDFGITYDGSVSVSTVARKMHMLDSNGYMEWFKSAWQYDPKRGPLPDLHADYPDLFNADGSPIYNTDWQDETLRTAISNRHYLTLTQGTEKSKNGLYVGYQNDEGILMKTGYRKTTARYNTEMNLRPWLTVGGDIAYNQTQSDRVDDYGVGGMNITRMMIEMLPIFPIKYPNGDWSQLNDFGYNFSSDGAHSKGSIYPADSPVRQLTEMKNLYTNDQILMSYFANINLAKGLTFKSTYSSQIFSQKTQLYTGKELQGVGPTGGGASITNSRTNYWQAENYLTYVKTINNVHHLNAVLGTSWMESTYESSGASSSKYSTDYYRYNNLGAGAVRGAPTSNFSDYKLNSYYGRFNYDYLGKYLLTFTGRYDGSSKFGMSNRYAVFPSGAIGWVVSKEKFLNDINFISFLKLRGSYGITGNSEISPYSSLGNMSTTTLSLNNQMIIGSIPSSIPNVNLKWEQTAQTDIGFDLEVLNKRVSLSADYYKKVTTNLLLNVPISTVTGYSSVTTNIGSVQNAGLEIALSGSIIENKDFNWNLGVIFAKNNNKILHLGATDADIFPGPNFLGETNILQVGQPVGNFWGFKRIGTWGNAEAAEAALYGKKPGDIKRLDVNGDHKFDNSDAMILGNMFAKYDMTFTTSLRYKNWNISADVQVKQGSKVLNVTSLTIEDRQYYANSYATYNKDAWTPENQNTMVPSARFSHVDPWGTDLPFFMDSNWIEDGSFIRGKNINLSYTFPKETATKIGLKNIKIYGNVQNFFLISSYREYDPEVSTFNGTFAQGIEFYGSPRPRSFTIGLNVTF